MLHHIVVIIVFCVKLDILDTLVGVEILAGGCIPGCAVNDVRDARLFQEIKILSIVSTPKVQKVKHLMKKIREIFHLKGMCTVFFDEDYYVAPKAENAIRQIVLLY